MGGSPYTDHDYSRAVDSYVSDSSKVTSSAEKQAILTGKLDPQVDPAMNGVIRQSKPRFIKNEALGLWQLESSIPMAIETRLDTTGSMGDNVDRALAALPKSYKLCSSVLPDYTLQLAIGIFADVCDRFVLCRPKFADSADRLVKRLTLMVPERNGGGNGGEDPQYGLFGAAYLTDVRIVRYGLKSYDFTISDEPAREHLSVDQLVRIFGPDVFAKVSENGFSIDQQDLPSTRDVVHDLLNRSHAFFIQIGYRGDTAHFWPTVFGKDRIVKLPDIDYLPYVQALVVGLTEGTLTIGTAANFLIENGVGAKMAEEMVRSVAHIPLGAQVTLKAKLERPLPKKGDFFREKTDLWPVDGTDLITQTEAPTVTKAAIEWL